MAFDPNEPLFRKEVEQEVEYEQQSDKTLYEFTVRTQAVVARGHRFIGDDGLDYTNVVMEALNTALVLQRVVHKTLAPVMVLFPVR